jgi:hypothetical protein
MSKTEVRRLFFGSPNQLRPQRIALNVSQDRQLVLVLLDRKGFEPTLPNVTARWITTTVATYAWSSAGVGAPGNSSFSRNRLVAPRLIFQMFGVYKRAYT